MSIHSRAQDGTFSSIRPLLTEALASTQAGALGKTWAQWAAFAFSHAKMFALACLVNFQQFFTAARVASWQALWLQLRRSRWAWALVCAVISGIGIGWGLGHLPAAAKWALAVFAMCVIAWSVLRLDETPVAIAGGLALIALKATTPQAFYAGMGDNLVWLMIASFILASVLKQSGVAQRWMMRALCGNGSHVTLELRSLFVRVTWLIIATAFVIPSTSGRAALLLPVYALLAPLLPAGTARRGLALLFPTVILLSACASLLGAGAHLVAVDFLAKMNLPAIGFAQWLLLGLPFALASSFAAMHLILLLFVSEGDRSAQLVILPEAARPFTRQQKAVATIVLAAMALWVLGGWLGLDAALVALLAALAATVKSLTGISLKEALKSVEWNLILFLAATMVMGEALLNTGAAQALADRAQALLPLAWRAQPMVIVLFVSLISLLAHCVITSRTARALVLIPTLALPLATGGINPAALVFIAVVGSGFCQTFAISAKPVALFSSQTEQAFSADDLWRLSTWLMPVMLVLLLVFAVALWPLLGLPLNLSNTSCMP